MSNHVGRYLFRFMLSAVIDGIAELLFRAVAAVVTMLEKIELKLKGSK